MENAASQRIATLKRTPLHELIREVETEHQTLARVDLVRIQQQTARLGSILSKKDWPLLLELDHALMTFSRLLVKHYTIERETILAPLQFPGLDPLSRQFDSVLHLDRLHHDHQKLQEALSDLQLSAHEIHAQTGTNESKKITQLVGSLADALHVQILIEDKVLLPRTTDMWSRSRLKNRTDSSL